VACGLIHPEDDLASLTALYVPHWVIWHPRWTEAVTRFVEGGGTLIVSALTATRDGSNRVIADPPPGSGLAGLLGVSVTEFGRIVAPEAAGLMSPVQSAFPGAFRDEELPRSTAAGRVWTLRHSKGTLPAAHLYEEIRPADGTETLATWTGSWLEGSPAVTLRRVGAGRAIYLGTYLTPDLADWLLDVLGDEGGLVPLLTGVPPGVEVTVRQTDDREIWFIQNTTRQEQILPDVPSGHYPVSGTRSAGGLLRLGPHGCAQIVRYRRTGN
jgi:beta-galactosidase